MYSTLSYLKTLQPESILLQLADDATVGAFVETAGSENAPYLVVKSAIEESDVLVDSYLSGRYDVPIAAPIPDIIRQMSGNLALCNLYDRRRELDIPEGIDSRRKRYMKILEDIKAEKANIPELAKTTPAAFVTDKSDTDQMFTDDLLDRM
jgi:phage gp36-like protein